MLQFAIAIKKKKKNVNDNDENWKYPRTIQIGEKKREPNVCEQKIVGLVSEWLNIVSSSNIYTTFHAMISRSAEHRYLSQQFNMYRK